jgi:hypothetical protein
LIVTDEDALPDVSVKVSAPSEVLSAVTGTETYPVLSESSVTTPVGEPE